MDTSASIPLDRASVDPEQSTTCCSQLSCCTKATIVVASVALVIIGALVAIGVTGGFEHFGQWVRDVAIPAVRDFMDTVVDMNVGEFLGKVLVPSIALATIIGLTYKHRTSIKEQWEAIKCPSCSPIKLDFKVTH